MTIRSFGRRVTRAIVIAAGVVALITALVLVDMLRKPTPDPLAGPWYRGDGRPVPDGDNGALVLDVIRGHEHCDWESAIFMMMAWPPGSRVGPPIPVEGERVHQFVRDPDGMVDPELAARFDTNAPLPRDARATDMKRGDWKLFITPSDDRFVYVVGSDVVERWPSSWFVPSKREPRSLFLCA